MYRGIANIGKKHGIMPHRKWRQEFDITLVPDYEELKKGNFDYSLSNIIQLPHTEERIALLRVPLIGKDGTFLMDYVVLRSVKAGLSLPTRNLPH